MEIHNVECGGLKHKYKSKHLLGWMWMVMPNNRVMLHVRGIGHMALVLECLYVWGTKATLSPNARNLGMNVCNERKNIQLLKMNECTSVSHIHKGRSQSSHTMFQYQNQWSKLDSWFVMVFDEKKNSDRLHFCNFGFLPWTSHTPCITMPLTSWFVKVFEEKKLWQTPLLQLWILPYE